MGRFETFIYGICLFLVFSSDSIAYKERTHAELSKKAYLKSDLGNRDHHFLLELGLIDKISDPAPKFPDESYFLGLTITGRNIRTIEELIEYGAEFEDDDSFFTKIVRPFNHFYDPQNNGRALTYGLLTGPPVNWPSPDWSLEDNFEVSSQNYSYHDAVRYFHNALTSTAKSERDRNWGLVFQTMGQVIHHVQDMAQPQHTRNDAHSPINSGTRQLYENYTQKILEKNGALPTSGYDIIDLNVFNTPRKFWDQNNGIGLAEFSSKNFVSAGTNFKGGVLSGNTIINAQTHDDYDFPGTDNIQVTSRNITDDDLLGPQTLGQPLIGKMHFVGTQVTDANDSSKSRDNPRTSSFSIFDSDLETFTNRAFTLNRFNFDAAHEFLIPRAVAYSAGLINYFFRGRIEAEITADGDGIEITNVSKGDSDFKAGGAFEVYYETDTGERKPLQSLTNLTLGTNLVIDGTHTITGLSTALDNATDIGEEGKIIVLFDGDIGAENERGLAVSNIVIPFGELEFIVGLFDSDVAQSLVLVPGPNYPSDGGPGFSTNGRIVFNNGYSIDLTPYVLDEFINGFAINSEVVYKYNAGWYYYTWLRHEGSVIVEGFMQGFRLRFGLGGELDPNGTAWIYSSSNANTYWEDLGILSGETATFIPY